MLNNRIVGIFPQPARRSFGNVLSRKFHIIQYLALEQEQAFLSFGFKRRRGGINDLQNQIGFFSFSQWAINSVKLNPTGANIPIHVDVQSVVINGETWNLGGYLDIGIVDTMKDLMVNFVGAVVFSVIGILYLKHRGKGKLAASLIPQVRDTDAEVSEK